MKKQDIADHILTTAETLVQTKGYNAFSYKDIANIVGVKTSSIHYYFPSKADLGVAVIKKHIEWLGAELEQLINKKYSCKKKLELFIESIFTNTYLSNRKMCLGGMFASDVLTLPQEIQREARVFFNRLQDWMKRLLTEAIDKKEFCIEKKEINNEAFFVFSIIEGALLLTRLFQDETHLISIKKQIIARYCKT